MPLGDGGTPRTGEEPPAGGTLEVGAPVRIIRDPYFGVIGVVAALPPELRRLESESKARVVDVQIGRDRRVTVPRANVELIEVVREEAGVQP